jgi:O-antigen/teichoic acid export membrane protein
MVRSSAGIGSRSASGPSVGASAYRALLWGFVNTAVARLGTVGVGIFLARLLGPEAFGAFAVAGVALAAVLSFNELGVSLAIVRWPSDPRKVVPTINSIAVGTSMVLAGLGYLLAPSFCAAMGDTRATVVVRVLLISVVLDGIASTPAALLQREFKGGRRAAIDQVNVWLSAAVSISCALLGLGAMSLAIGRVVGSSISCAALLASSPAPYRFGFDRREAKGLIRFGLPLAASSLLVFGLGFADQLIVGAVLGTTALGYYVLAFNMASWPVAMFSQPLRGVAPAAFARLQHDVPAMLAAFRSMVGALAGLTAPICVLLAVAASPVILFVYGSEWAPSAHVLLWLAISALFRIFFELVYDFLVVLRRTSAILVTQLVWVIVLVPALIVGAHVGGIGGVAASQALVAGLLILPLYILRISAAGLRPRALLTRVWGPMGLAVCAGAVGLVLTYRIDQPFLACLAVGVLGLCTVALLLMRDRRDLAALRRMGQEEVET